MNRFDLTSPIGDLGFSDEQIADMHQQVAATFPPMRIPVMHTPTDLERFAREGVDPDSTQPRENEVPCARCKRGTWNVNRLCDNHQVKP